MSRLLKLFFVSLALTPALSLGSGSGGSGAPDLSADYDIGKKVFYTKVFCDSCPYPDLAIPDGIPEIAPDLQRGGEIGKYLSIKERKSVALFIRRQFNISI